MTSRLLRHLLSAALVLTAILAGTFGGSGIASAANPELPSFSTEPGLAPAFGWNKSDYVVRCAGATLEVSVDSPEGWRGAIGTGNLRAGSFSVKRSLRPNRRITVRFNKASTGQSRQFQVRCLPADFPEFDFDGSWKGGPRLVMIQMNRRYAVAFDRNGAPVWWFKAPEGQTNNAQLLHDGTFAYAPVDGVSFRRFQIRSLTGRDIRTISAAGNTGTDLHELLLLPNGNYLLGVHRMVRGIDTSRFGGKVNSTIDTAQMQEQTPSGKVVWKWNAWPRIGLAETGRWWKTIGKWGEPYDVHHWNSIERRGRNIIMSFRHLDAVYKIDRRTGRINWKLGGTKTNKRLKVRKDPHGAYPFGGQHDARYQPDGSITVLDNASYLKREQPRGVRYKIDPRKKTATMIEQVKDPAVPVSVAMASGRLISGNWFIGWGAIGSNGIAGGYAPGGNPLFRLHTPGGFSYRMNPVTSKRPGIKQLRRAMDQMRDTSS